MVKIKTLQMTVLYSLKHVCLAFFVAISQFNTCSGALLYFYLLQLFEFPPQRQTISSPHWIFQQRTWIHINSLESSISKG